MNDKPSRKLKSSDAEALIKEVIDNIQTSWEHDRDNREEAAKDLTMLAGDQWPESVRREREAARRPMLTINRLPQFVRQITNDIRQADIAIKVVPEDDDQDPALAEIYDGIIRQIQYRSSARHVYSTAAEHQASCGIGWWRVSSDYADDMVFDQEIKLSVVKNPLSVYCDPGAILPDRSDAMWIAVTEMVPKSTFERRYPKAKAVEVTTPTSGYDRPFYWSTTDNVRIAEYWRKTRVTKQLALLETGETIDITGKGEAELGQLPIVRTRDCETHKVEQYIISGAEVLEGPYEWAGKYIPLVPVIGGEFPLENKLYRYGAIRFARDPQQLYNFYRTATAESIALAPKAPYLATPNMIGPFKAMWDTANTQNNPYLLYKPDPEAPGAAPKREHPPEMPTALMQEAQVASDDMKGTTGIYDAALGDKSNETAGIAISRRQAESDVANYHFSDNLQRSLEYCGRILIDLIPKIYDNERVIRLLGPEASNDEQKFVRINQVAYSDMGEPVVFNDLSAASFDVRVTVGRSYATKRIEAANSMIEFMRAVPQAAPVIGDLLAKAMDWPEADEIARRLKNMVPPALLADPNKPETMPPPQEPDPMMVADVELKRAQATKASAEALKAQLEAAAMEQGGVQPQLVEPEIVDPAGMAVKQAAARKAMADAEVAELNVEKTRREIERGDHEMAEKQEAKGKETEREDKAAQSNDELRQMVAQMIKLQTAPKRIVRDENGRPAGVETVLDQLQGAE